MRARAKAGTISGIGATSAVASRTMASRRRFSGRTSIAASRAAFSEPGWSTTGELTSSRLGMPRAFAVAIPSPPKL